MRTAILVLVLTLLLLGCGPARESASRDAPLGIASIAPSDVATEVVGGSPAQQELLHEILAGIDSTMIRAVEVETDVEKAWGAPPNAVGIHAKATEPDPYAYWQAELVVDAFARRSFELGLPPVAYIGYAGEQIGGIDWSEDLEPSLTRAEADNALRRVESIAERYAASPRTRVFEPRRPAFAVEFRVRDPAAFLLRGLEPALTPLSGSDGLYVKVVDAKGRRAFESGPVGWIRPELAACSPYDRFGTPFRPPPPPCPAR